MSSIDFMRKVIARCNDCNDINYMICMDTTDEIKNATKEINRMEKKGIKFEILDHTSEDDYPKWCTCHEIPKS